ncbi:MAG TPA: tRNA (adenosine(37)-N6)-threonylcarbamoyltransferase complex transferase subunit TsaD [Acholeplasma sp.]|jgi:N6-L-threonylcarbamoyladenine synthase|nr:tRNA (adenosine(37)-N6)-threonylcarbamoyltransferase complex transferase subunit TsaD [Acholeplasma sp.]
MIVLGVETSCDETAVSIVKDGKEVLANIVYSQIAIHQEFGGVIPEVASRHHVLKITYVLEAALKKANLEAKDIDLVAVTSTPGLIGSLMVGVNAAKAFALANEIEYIEVNHLIGHIYANYIEKDFVFPLLALVVSGGHTELVLMKDHYQFEILGQTLDDAVGEAYDKVGRVLDLPYPAGKPLDDLALMGDATYNLPYVYLDKDSYNFSFSGLKSAVLNLVNSTKQKGEAINKANLAASFQNSVVSVLVSKTIKAALEYKVKQIIVAGGVAANKGLRAKLKEAVSKIPNLELTFPKFEYCTDNAAMIAVAGYFKYKLQVK